MGDDGGPWAAIATSLRSRVGGCARSGCLRAWKALRSLRTRKELPRSASARLVPFDDAPSLVLRSSPGEWGEKAASAAALCRSEDRPHAHRPGVSGKLSGRWRRNLLCGPGPVSHRARSAVIEKLQDVSARCARAGSTMARLGPRLPCPRWPHISRCRPRDCCDHGMAAGRSHGSGPQPPALAYKGEDVALAVAEHGHTIAALAEAAALAAQAQVAIPALAISLSDTSRARFVRDGAAAPCARPTPGPAHQGPRAAARSRRPAASIGCSSTRGPLPLPISPSPRPASLAVVVKLISLVFLDRQPHGGPSCRRPPCLQLQLFDHACGRQPWQLPRKAV